MVNGGGGGGGCPKLEASEWGLGSRVPVIKLEYITVREMRTVFLVSTQLSLKLILVYMLLNFSLPLKQA